MTFVRKSNFSVFTTIEAVMAKNDLLCSSEQLPIAIGFFIALSAYTGPCTMQLITFLRLNFSCMFNALMGMIVLEVKISLVSPLVTFDVEL